MKRALVSILFLLSGSTVAAFNVGPNKKLKMPSVEATNKNLANVVLAGVISASTIVPLVTAPAPAMALENQVLKAKLETFGKSSYSVFNAITDVSPLADKFIEFVDGKIKAKDSAAVAQTGVDALLAIPDSAIATYRSALKSQVYAGVSPATCVTLDGSGKFFKAFENSAAVKSVSPSKMVALQSKFNPANSAVPKRNGNICLPGSVDASAKLWVAQADLTFSMPAKEGGELVRAIKTAGKQIPRSSIAELVPVAKGVFSKSPEAIRMAAAGYDVEPNVISTVKALTK